MKNRTRARLVALSMAAILFSGVAVAQLPDTPKPQPKTWEEVHGKPARFFTFRGHPDSDPPLHSNRQVFTSKTIIAAHALGFASMAYACSHKNTGEEFHAEVPAMLAVAALDYLMDRFMTRSYAIGPQVYAVQHYIRASIR